MGVSFAKKNTKRAPNDEFRRVAKGVVHIKRLREESKQPGANQKAVTKLSPNQIAAESGATDGARNTEIGNSDDNPVSENIAGSTGRENEENTQNAATGVIFKDTSSAWEALKRGESYDGELPDTELRVVRPKRNVGHVMNADVGEHKETGHKHHLDVKHDVNSSEEVFSIVPYELPSDWEERISSNASCAMCQLSSIDMFPCRICPRVYHENCLRRKGRLNRPNDVDALQRATTITGWSCLECENLAQLLQQGDMEEIMDTFERCDKDNDGLITLEEYLKYQQNIIEQRDGQEMTPSQIQEQQMKFSTIDRDHGGTISWWEFLNHEALRRLATLPQRKLYTLLTPKEIDRAHQTFVVFDTDRNGNITTFEARRAYEHWFSYFTSPPVDKTEREQQLSSLTTHIDTNTAILMAADTDQSGNISWEEFILEQALYIIAARPNHGPVKIKPGPHFIEP